MPPSMNSHRMIAAAPIHTALVVSHTSFPPAANSFAIGSTVNWCIGSNLPASADTRVTPNYPWGHRAAGLNLTYSEPFLPREAALAIRKIFLKATTTPRASLTNKPQGAFPAKRSSSQPLHDPPSIPPSTSARTPFPTLQLCFVEPRVG